MTRVRDKVTEKLRVRDKVRVGTNLGSGTGHCGLGVDATTSVPVWFGHQTTR